MLGEWKAQLRECIGTTAYRLFLYRPLYDGTEFLLQDGSVKKVVEGAPAEEDIYFAVLTDEQMRALADTFANKGVRTVSDHRNEGLLEATRLHLADMRKLVLKERA